MIYLDNSATTKPNAACVSAMTRLLCDHWGNPSSVHDLGIEAERELKSARKAVANALGAEPDRVFFTSGGTEADNWAIFSACERLGKRGSARPQKRWCGCCPKFNPDTLLHMRPTKEGSS